MIVSDKQFVDFNFDPCYNDIMKIFYMGLESYQARYTYQLTDWTKRAYDKRKIDYVIVPGDTIDDSEAIVTGQVLDAHGRSYFGMSQMMNLVQMMKKHHWSGLKI